MFLHGFEKSEILETCNKSEMDLQEEGGETDVDVVRKVWIGFHPFVTRVSHKRTLSDD